MAASPDTADLGGTPLRTDRDFRLYLASRTVSVAGALVAAVAFPVLVYRLTGSPAWTSAVAAAGALPYLMFGLLAGAAADRFDRRALMVGADLLSAAALAGVPAAWALGVLTPGQVLGTAFAVQALYVVFDAANFGALPRLLGKDRLTAGYAAVYGATNLVELAVPPLVGLVVAAAAPAPLISVSALTALASAAMVRALARPLSEPRPAAGPAPGRRPAAPRALLADIRGGLSFLFGDAIVRTLTLAGTTHAAASGAWTAMLVPWADRTLGVAPAGDPRLAVLFGCWGAGAVAASRLVPWLSDRFRPARLALGALPASLLAGAGTALCTDWRAAAACAAAWGTAYSVVVVNAITYRQLVTPLHLQSRVNTTARMLSWGIGHPAGAALAGAVATLGAGPRAGLAAGLAVAALGVAAAWLSPLRAAARTGPDGDRPARA
ncbi:MFS transporter [Nocardiopsis composta]|uniref:MFS family permease n=1 Tax=Nocardiopsis composta TaxID=157465 RepID=A0A7W8VFC5_9ACTN|nr:MFS transporter [Nocardiopsis composta]MBB5433973.1 MFS family permease [Nocardiopsis composta]